MATQKAPQAPMNRRTTYQGAGARSTGRGSTVTTGGGGSTVTVNPGSQRGATGTRRPASPRPASPGQGSARQPRQQQPRQQPRRQQPSQPRQQQPRQRRVRLQRRQYGSDGGGTNYQAVILAEFVAAELLVAATPMATRKNQPGLSPYVPSDLVKLAAIGLVYFILQLVASGARAPGRIAAWFGALVLLAVGLNEAADLAKVFSFLSGGTGKASTTAVSTTATGPPSGLQQFIANEPTLSTTETASSSGGSGGSGGSGPVLGGGTGPKSGTSFVQEAGKFIGTPYKWGGASPGGFDCSGLVQYALDKLGLKNVPRTSEQQWGWVQRIPQSQLAPGDLVFEQWPGEVSPGHVAIYAGNNEIIQAPSQGQDVQKVHWSPSIVHAQGGQIVGYGRVPGLSYGAPVKIL